MSLASDLENARPGETIEFTGEQRLGRVENVRGEADAWVELVGGDDSAVLIPDRSYVYACARFADARYFRMRNFTVDGEGWAERGLQIWTSEWIELDGLVVLGCKFDGLHFVGSNHTRTYRYRFDGAGGDWLRPGVAGHGAYWTILDGGDDVEDNLIEDAEVVDCLGAPFQGNGENRWCRDLTFRRVLATDWRNGCGVNLGRCQDVTIEDLTLSSNEEEANGGVRGFDGSSGIRVVRHSISLPPGVPRFEGVDDTVAGTPSPPEFSEAPPPVEPEPTPEPEAGYQYCPSCDGGRTQLGPEGNLMPCATCLGTGQIPLPS